MPASALTNVATMSRSASAAESHRLPLGGPTSAVAGFSGASAKHAARNSVKPIA
ncbi:MAG: hypothetical protein HXY18_08985 [Bryobacteraceae bacterium]|nr:hypothetical protein [Bryobacteraceae bacterium]